MRRILAVLVAAWLCGVSPVVAPAGEGSGDAPTVDLPLTIEKLWYRAGGKRREGYLMVGEEGFEITARKKAFSIPVDRIQFISFGTMRGDVDTEWVRLTVGVAPPYDVVGLRDGKKWGFGGRTREIYLQLRRVLKQLSAGQFRVAPGYRIYEDPDYRCAIAIPEDWSSYLESLVVISGSTPGSTTVLSEQPIREVETTAAGTVRAVDDLELLDAILAGERPAFLLRREQAGRGMECRGFSKGARERVLARARAHLLFGEDYEVVEPPRASPAVVGGCDGLRVLGRSRRPDGVEVVLELHAAAPGETLYTFELRAVSDRLEEFRKPFAEAVASANFGVLAPR
jgi:hypothetical protein